MAMESFSSSSSRTSLLKVYMVAVILLSIAFMPSTCWACNCKGGTHTPSTPRHSSGSSSKHPPSSSSHQHAHPVSPSHPGPIFPTPTPPTTRPPKSPAPSTPTPTPIHPPRTPSTPTPTPIQPAPMLPPVPTVPSVPTPAIPTPSSPPPPLTCPVNIIKLGVCVPLLGGVLGNPLQTDCCALLGILGLDVEVCLCLAVDANVLGIITIHAKIDVIATILTTCGYKVPPNLSCP